MPTLESAMGKPLVDDKVVEAFYLRYDHGLFAFTTAIRADTKEMVVCVDPNVAEEVRQLLDPGRRDRVKLERAMFLSQGNVGYFIDNSLKGKAEQVTILTHQDIERICTGHTEPFFLRDFAA